MALQEQIKVSDVAKNRLENYRDEFGHTSFDSAIRELIAENQRLQNELSTRGCEQ